MLLALSGCEFVLGGEVSEYLRATIAAGAATLYSSPFTAANELGSLEEDFSKFSDPTLAATHRNTLTFRNQLYAHRDLSINGTRIPDGLVAPLHFIDVEILPNGAAKTSGSLIQWPNDAFQRLKDLCVFQRDRLMKKEIKLMRQLAERKPYPPGRYRLGIDFP